ncbi:alpha-glucosidase [Bacteroidia bacterium]|nr:alpha-glucosidase [Bacteroidia bacterium]
MGIDRNDGQFSQNLKLVTVLPAQTIDETYTLKSGKKLECRNYFNEQVFVFKNEQNARMHLIVRAYNDGIAFRYYFPGKQKTTLRIVNEKTGFFIPKDGKAWIQPYDWNVRLKPSYEQYYRNEMAVGDPSPNKTGWAYPLLFHRDNVWMMITEATLDGSYCATHVNNTPDGLYTIAFAEKEEVVIPDDPEPVVSLPLATPWRTIILSDDLSGIVETNLVQNLNRPCALQDVSWILPGRSSWSWWHNGSTVRDYNAQIQYVNLSAEMGWEYMLIDSGWEKMQGGTMEDVVGYANQKGVGVWLWYHSGSGRENDSITQRNIMAFPELRRAEFQYLQKTGVKGVKIDFFDTDKQGIVQRYEEILADAAACHIMVNFHGATLPRGLERTYPNLMTVEAVKGAEGFGRQPSCDNAPWHNATLPFTRNVVGSMDYTPVTFSNKIKEGVEAQQVTTWGHQLALSVVFESGVQNFADKAESYLSLPEAPKTFLQNIPVAWDETKLAAGYPGDFVVMARRKGNGWYIGGINGKNEARRITFELPFIPAGKDIHFITDGEDKKTFTEKTAVTGQTIEIAVLPYGGFAGTTIESLLK